jgi:hypothetical protein
MIRVVMRVLMVVLARPTLWWVALRVGGRIVRSNWWRRPPFLPVPSRSYIRFRLETQYGTIGSRELGAMAHTVAGDVLKYLRWVREWESVAA